MKTTLIIPTLLSFILIGLQEVKSQEKLYISYFESINMPKSYSNSATKLFKSYLAAENKFNIVELPAWDSTYTIENAKKARESAELYGTKYFIVGEVNKLGDIILVSVALHNTSDGSLIWQTYEKGYNETDVNILLERIAQRAAPEGLNDIPVAYDGLTQFETKTSMNKKVKTSFGLNFGMAYPFIKENEELAPLFGIRFSFDADDFQYDLYWETFNNDQNSMTSVGMDVSYLFGENSGTFFALAGIGYGGLKYSITNEPNKFTYEINYQVEEKGAIGFLGGGYLINRNRKVQVKLTLKGFYAFVELVPEGRPLDQPIGAIFTSTILFN